MGSSGSKSKNKKGKQGQEKPNSSQEKPQNKQSSKEQKIIQPPIERHLTKRQRRYNPPKRGPLTFKEVNENQNNTIDQNSNEVKSLKADRWIINPQTIEQYRTKNIFEIIQQSPALALQLTLVSSATYLIGNHERLELQRQKTRNQEKNSEAVIYADLFSIKFQFLRKIKLKGPQKNAQGAITSLERIALIYAPLIEEFTADDHPITNVRFLRRCIWPFLSKLSLKNNNIVDSNELAKTLPYITNVQHIQGIDMAGQNAKKWIEVGWICKMGFLDAERQFELLQNDEKYYYRYYNKILRRIDCSLNDNKMARAIITVIRNKFNNPYFDNPISIW